MWGWVVGGRGELVVVVYALLWKLGGGWVSINVQGTSDSKLDYLHLIIVLSVDDGVLSIKFCLLKIATAKLRY